MTYDEDKALISGCVYYDVPRILLWGILRKEIPYISGEFLLWDFSYSASISWYTTIYYAQARLGRYSNTLIARITGCQ